MQVCALPLFCDKSSFDIVGFQSGPLGLPLNVSTLGWLMIPPFQGKENSLKHQNRQQKKKLGPEDVKSVSEQMIRVCIGPYFSTCNSGGPTYLKHSQHGTSNHSSTKPSSPILRNPLAH